MVLALVQRSVVSRGLTGRYGAVPVFDPDAGADPAVPVVQANA